MMQTARFAAEMVGWLAIAYGAWWMFLLALECLAVFLSLKWRRFVRCGRLAIYFAGAGESLGTVTSFSSGGQRFDQLFWLIFWKRTAPPNETRRAKEDQ